MDLSNVAVNLLALLVDGMFIYSVYTPEMGTLGHASVAGLLSERFPSQYAIHGP